MRKALTVIFALVFSTALPTSASATETINVMSRNLYLGSDVGIALKLIPNFPAAAQFMWDQVKATDFSKRAPVLAQEVISNNADIVGLQEATRWFCKKNAWSKRVVIYDFTQQFLSATKSAGHEYVLATKDGIEALNIGYSIPAIPYLTMVKDPATFQPIFGTDSAACGFEIGDALVIKKSLASSIEAVGNSEYEASYSIVPKLMTIYRGYSWADLKIHNSTVRVVTTHLESLWDANKVPRAAIQSEQLIEDLSDTRMPLIVIGDFNSDPRDPRRDAAHNPGGQPEASDACPAQVNKPDVKSALDACNAYWKMVRAGFNDVGPDAQNPVNFTWGMSALLKGPEPARLKAAREMGNTYGFTDRLDYIFTKNGIKVNTSKIVGNTYPQGSVWQCGSDLCNDTDHASVVATITLPDSTIESNALPAHAPFPISFWNWVGIVMVLLISALIYRRKKRITS